LKKNNKNEKWIAYLSLNLAYSEKKITVKGTVSRELRPRLLYIIRKLFSRPIIAGHKIYILLKGHFTIYMKQFSVSKAGSCYFG